MKKSDKKEYELDRAYDYADAYGFSNAAANVGFVKRRARRKLRHDKKRGLRSQAYLYEDYCGDDIEFEPEGNIVESHVDENGIIIVDKFEITGISAYCERKRKEQK